MPPEDDILIEACVTSVQEARAAERAGADRLELCVNLEVGGLSPSADLLHTVVETVRVPVMAMVRLRPGGFQVDSLDVQEMSQQIAHLRAAGAAGIVLGVLDANGSVDTASLAKLVGAAAPLPVTFHKAIDQVPDPLEALNDLQQAGVSRILTSGLAETAWDGRKTLRTLVDRGGLKIMGGGGVRGPHAAALLNETGAPELHARADAIPDLVNALRPLPAGGRVDHLVYTAGTLEEGIQSVERLLGIRASPGGRHPQWGTHNALLAIGPGAYLEIIAPDPELEAPAQGPLAYRRGKPPHLLTWVLKSSEVPSSCAALADRGVPMGQVQPGQRRTPDGNLLKWTLSDPYAERLGGTVPFLIDWGSTPHPAQTAPYAGRLLRLGIGHSEPQRVARALRGLGVELPVSQTDLPRIEARIKTPSGPVTLPGLAPTGPVG